MILGVRIMVNKDLVRYIKDKIFPIYNKNDKAHRLDHVNYVIDRSMRFANTVDDIDMDMVYTIAAYHDIAHHIDAATHEALSAKYLLEDKGIREYFSDSSIKIMAEAIEDHRASIDYEPRSVYGKIVSSADRNTDIPTPLMRTYEYRKNHSPHMSDDEIMEECRQHLLDKFGATGYAKTKMYFKDEAYEKFLLDLDTLARDKTAFKKEFYKVNNIK